MSPFYIEIMNKYFLKNSVILPTIVLILAACEPRIRTWELYSPDESLSIVMTHTRLDQEGKTDLSYQVFLKTDTGDLEVIEPSHLGIIRQDAPFTDRLIYSSETDVTDFSGSYELISGKKRKIDYTGNELTVTFKNDSSQLLAIDLRALNNGVAFRYHFPEADSTLYKVTGEITSFTVPMPGKAWIQPYDTVTKWTPAYEPFYENNITIGEKSPQSEGWAFPALYATHNIWMLITEANLDDRFYAAHMEAEAENGMYRIRLPEKEEARNTCIREPVSSLPWKTPWRVIMVGKTLADIIESTLIEDLSEDCIVEDIRWIKPGRASWSWWSDHESPQDIDKLKKFVDLAEEMEWEYSLVDANWNRMKGGSLEDLVQYANGKNIGILVWYNSGGPHNSVEEQVRDRMHIKERRREEFARLQEWGVKGVKIDFFQSDKPEIIKLYHDILKDAIDFQIMVNFHGCTLPRGWERKYPHLMSMEAVRGAECYSFDRRYPDAAPWHNTILPFTRNVVGPMDYTPVAFSDQTYPHITTYGHEIALPVVFLSGILHFADRVSAFRELPDFAKDFLKEIPVSWDQTKLLEGYPGKYVVLARQKEGSWYFGGINGLSDTINIDLQLPFIKDGSYLAEIITDGQKDRSFLYYKKPFDNHTVLKIKLKPYGGIVGKLIDFKKLAE